MIDDLHAGKNVLVRWTYTLEEWSNFVASENSQSKNTTLTTLLLVLVPAALVSGGISIATLFALAIVALIFWLTLRLCVQETRVMYSGVCPWVMCCYQAILE